MSTLNPPALPDLSTRRIPSYGGFNRTALKLEIRRLLRNRRTVIITMAFPVFFFLLFGLNSTYALLLDPARTGTSSALVMISLELYGAVAATTFGGAMVSIERAQGWSRQLRLTPLSPVAYIAMKVITALVLGRRVRHRGEHRRPADEQGVDAGLPLGRDRRCASGSARCCSPRSGCSWATCCRPRTSCS